MSLSSLHITYLILTMHWWKQALFLTQFYRWKTEAQRGKIIHSNVVSRWSWDKDSVILDPSASKARLVKIDIWVHSHGEQFIKLRLGRKHGNEVNSKCKNQLLEKYDKTWRLENYMNWELWGNQCSLFGNGNNNGDIDLNGVQMS